MPDTIILQRRGGNLRGGRFGFVARLQSAINQALIACGREGAGVDGIFGSKSREAVQRLAGCPGFDELGLGAGQPNGGVVTAGLWRVLFPGEAPPSVKERAQVLWLTHEATDYDTVEFNFTSSGAPQPNDPRSFLTWGPFGATVGHGREVQQVLKRREADAVLDACFGREAAVLRALVATESEAEAAEQVRSAFLDRERRRAWTAGFQCLGARAEVREAYDAVAFGAHSTWLLPPLERLAGLLPGGRMTEIDGAFFIDLAMHMGISSARLAAARRAIDRREAELGRALNPAERRREIGQGLVAELSNQVEDRRGRNVVYYVDGLDEDVLSHQERDAWQQRSGVRASDVALTDEEFDWR